LSRVGSSSHVHPHTCARTNMAESELTCAICFDAFDEPTPLPCACKIDYCTKCWDRALAQSFKSTLHARCPTCRSPVHVDFDPERCRLVFSLDTRPTVDLAGMRQLHASAVGGSPEARQQLLELRQRVAQDHADTVNRLAVQAIPVQTRLLQQFGAANPHLVQFAFSEDGVRHAVEDGAGALNDASTEALAHHLSALGRAEASRGAPGEEVLGGLLDAVGGSGTLLASRRASADGVVVTPKCVCGDTLRRLQGKDRVSHKLISDGFAHGSPQFVHTMASHQRRDSCGVICDICDAKVTWVAAVWTCVAGTSTILHPASYDICDACFMKHTFGCDGTSGSSRSAA